MFPHRNRGEQHGQWREILVFSSRKGRPLLVLPPGYPSLNRYLADRHSIFVGSSHTGLGTRTHVLRFGVSCLCQPTHPLLSRPNGLPDMVWGQQRSGTEYPQYMRRQRTSQRKRCDAAHLLLDRAIELSSLVAS